MKKEFERRFEVRAHTLGPETGQEREVRILNRVIRWTEDGLEYEPDQRHSEIAIRELGLEGARAVATPGTKEELALAGVPGAASKSSPVPAARLSHPEKDWPVPCRVPALCAETAMAVGSEQPGHLHGLRLGRVQGNLPKHQRRCGPTRRALPEDVVQHAGNCGALQRGGGDLRFDERRSPSTGHAIAAG